MNQQWTVMKEVEVAVSHKLELDYFSKCNNLHGHNLKIRVYITAYKLNQNNMVYDFSYIKQQVSDFLDHKHLNTIFPEEKNITVEFLAREICNKLEGCTRVEIEESPSSVVCYEQV